MFVVELISQELHEKLNRETETAKLVMTNRNTFRTS